MSKRPGVVRRSDNRCRSGTAEERGLQMSEATKAADAATWDLIHQERASIANTLAELDDEQWTRASACGSWTVRQTAAHIVLGAEQTGPHFMLMPRYVRQSTVIEHL